MKKKIVIVGGGSSALLLCCELDPKKFDVYLFEKNATLGRKFLVAGEGGLNLTHSENEKKFILRYTPFDFFEEVFSNFSNTHFIKWLNAIGIETYVGSSGRVFPKRGIKPIEVLNHILSKIKENKVNVFPRHVWQGFSKEGKLVFDSNEGKKEIGGDYFVFCLGGASWPVTGSVGDWTEYFRQKDIVIEPFQPSNCTFCINWEKNFIPKIEGRVLKNISITCANKKHLGEIVFTKLGIEGSGIYPLSPEIRQQLAHFGTAEISIDFKPEVPLEKILNRLTLKPSSMNTTEYLKTQLSLNETHIALLKHFLPKEDFLNTTLLSGHIKLFKISITATGPIDAAISTVGGIALSEIDEKFQLKKKPAHFAIGEMLDYDAPTGGYLLQSCFSMAKYLADCLNSEPLATVNHE